MQIKINGDIVICHSETVVIFNGQSVLDFFTSINKCRKIAINKEAICEDFFDLSTGVAGEVAQKLVNYQFCMSVIGDFSYYDSNALHDYILECNRTNGPLCFAVDEAEAVGFLRGRD